MTIVDLLKKIKISIGIIICITLNNAFAHNSNVILFGDSLTDVGNNQWVSVDGKIGTPITNEDSHTKKKWLWINEAVSIYFPKKEIYPSSELHSRSLNPLTDNIDYAWASAETGLHYINDVSPDVFYFQYNDDICIKHGAGKIDDANTCVPGVRLQVKQYLADVHYHPSRETIFILWAGGNDIFGNFMKLLISGRSLESINATLLTEENPSHELSDLSFPIVNLVKAKNDLIDSGVSPNQIYIIDLVDLSKIPAMKELAEMNPKLVDQMHEISILYNSSLYSGMTKSSDQYALSESHFFSANQLFLSVLKNPASFNFSNTQDSCVLNNATPNCDGYLFFNNKHPSVMTGKIFGQQLSVLLSKNQPNII